MKFPKNKPVTIAVHNIFFEGMSIDYRFAIFDWGLVVSLVGLGLKKLLLKRQSKNRNHPVLELIQKCDPDILILNETMPDINEQTKRILAEHNYMYTIGYPKDSNWRIPWATIIATKYTGDSHLFQIPGSGGGSAEYRFKYVPISLVALHTSALNRKIRLDQIKYAVQHTKKLLNQGIFPIIAGDLNEEIDSFYYLFKNLPISHYTLPTFPSKNIFRFLQKKQWWMLRKILKLKNIQRSIDHIFLPQKWKVTSLTSYATSSDHDALIIKTIPNWIYPQNLVIIRFRDASAITVTGSKIQKIIRAYYHFPQSAVFIFQ
jgi:hypothetical protein